MFGRVCQHQSLGAELVSNESAAVDLVPLTITQLAPVRSASGKPAMTASDRQWQERGEIVATSHDGTAGL